MRQLSASCQMWFCAMFSVIRHCQRSHLKKENAQKQSLFDQEANCR